MEIISPYLAPAFHKQTSSCDNVINIICSYYGVTFEEINVRLRKQEYVLPRQVIMIFLMHYCKLSTHEASRYFNRDHSTASHSKKAIAGLYQTEKKMRHDIAQIMQMLNYSIYQTKELINQLNNY